MIEHHKDFFLREYSSSVCLKLFSCVNSTANGTSCVYLCLHEICTLHRSIVTNPINGELLYCKTLGQEGYGREGENMGEGGRGREKGGGLKEKNWEMIAE